ncbi:toll-like receptor 8 isoform X3 [Mytilus californianus]|uniref:toll-like receptor 8 isoform X3 n=1 Tax=Mytilus californianus TaxID=6549 RepID=UPI0022481FB1|nr:toll-like receptor 8 isoform X3 [Mytilus californianus]
MRMLKMTGYKQCVYFVIGCLVSTSITATIVNEKDVHIEGYFRWEHPSIASKFLFCMQCCKKLPFEKGSCFPVMYMNNNRDSAACCSTIKSKPFWEFRKYSYLKGDLFIEYNSLIGFAKIVSKNKYQLYDLEHHHGFLKEFPDNICNFPTIVRMDLSWNRIQFLPSLECLQSLDSLILSDNKIKRIDASSLASLSNLRQIDFSYNRIEYLEPGCFSYRPGSLLKIHLQYNNIKSIDISDLILKHYFDFIKIFNNDLRTITNLKNNTGFVNGSIGGGLIQMMNNSFTNLPMYNTLGFSADDALKIVFRYTIDVLYNKWICDCKMWDGYLVMASQAMDQYYTLGTPKCVYPPHLKGYNIGYFRIKNHTADLLICNITVKEKCPQRCYCFDQPSKNRVVVNCTSQLYVSMPHVVPDLSGLDIDLRHNKITFFKKHEYLERTIRIDLSFNVIVNIDPSIYGIQNILFIDLRNNRIQTLHRELLLKDSCAIGFGKITVKCTCDMMWIKHWLDRQHAVNCSYSQITCETHESFINAALISKSDLCKDQNIERSFMSYILLGVTIISVATGTFLCSQFKYEILLLLRNLRSKRQIDISFHYRSLNNVLVETDDETYDAYLSFDENNEIIRKWVVEDLIKYLESKGYKLCLPCRDFGVGMIREEEIRRKILKCKSYIVLLSEEYLEDHFANHEWKLIWNNFKHDRSKRIAIINYDIMESGCVKQRNMKAFLRLGFAIDFCNTDHQLMQEIIHKLGQPVDLQKY